ncbi:[histone H3]-lysine(4) N-trimethyltransferase [Trifolium repens]|nr:[histone H3]-lysine(4) N-trimethyltransferase [Trifolium repens]
MSRSIPTEDRISSLPDTILYHILSFLPTKSAAATSILSKRWYPLWLSVPTLRFNDKHFKDFISFRHFVSSVFLSRDIKLPIKSFYLKCQKKQNSNAHDITRFIHAALQQGGIENLHLCSRIFLNVKLPHSIFTCKTLVVLHLRKVNMNYFSHVVVDLPCLKTLHLSHVIYQRYQYLPKFLLRCPSLEELHMKTVLLPSPESLDLEGNFQYLPNLITANIYSESVLFNLCCRAEVLRVEMHSIQSCQFPMYYNLTCIKLILKENHPKKWNWLLEMLNHCPKLQNIIIHEDYGHEYEALDNWMDPTIVPECLSTQLNRCALDGYRNTECEIEFAKYILQNSKVLNNMLIRSASDLDLNVKHQMITDLTSSRRASTTCELFFQ